MKEPPDRNRLFLTILAEILQGITLQGFAIRHVLPSEHEPGFSFTIGLHKSGSTRPELLISGLSPVMSNAWLIDLGFRIQGPPPWETRRQMASVQGVPMGSLVFPEGGQEFAPGKLYHQLSDSDLPTMFGEVEEHHYDDHFGPALAFHQGRQFPVLQMVWSDTFGKFPWEDSFERRFVGRQRLLFDPQRYLPLTDAEV